MRGTMSEYPFVISAIRKTPVRGACSIPAITPPMPTKAKFVTFKEPKRAEYLMCRRQITVDAYLRAKNEGDNNVYFIDGARSLGSDAEAQEATVDGTHPTDLGFMSMANSLYPLLRRLVYGVDVAEEQL